jgi:3-oxoacyl-[acyl-carrier-protein] synthase III
MRLRLAKKMMDEAVRSQYRSRYSEAQLEAALRRYERSKEAKAAERYCTIQDGTERKVEPTMAAAVRWMKTAAKMLNGATITRADIDVFVPKQVAHTEWVLRGTK